MYEVSCYGVKVPSTDVYSEVTEKHSVSSVPYFLHFGPMGNRVSDFWCTPMPYLNGTSD